jgi:uncharacterized protein DUF6745
MLNVLRDQPSNDAVSGYLQRWAAAQLACAPANRRVADEGVRLAYATAGLNPPQRIVWCGGPLEITDALKRVRATDRVGASVKAQVFDQVRQQVGIFAEVFCNEVIAAAARLTNDAPQRSPMHGYDAYKAVSAAVDRCVRDAASLDLATLTIRARHALLRLRGMPRVLPRESFEEVAVGPSDFACLGPYAYLHDVLAWQEPAQSMRGWWTIVKNAGWIVPYEHVCWICEPPSTLHWDARGRLHRLKGPALCYRDGWCVHVWKGVQVPAWMIEHPELITPARIDDTFDPVLRNSMIEIMTPERFVQTGGVAKVAEDEAGVLWRKTWSFRGVAIGSWCAVEVVNAPEPDGSCRHYFLRVPSSMRAAREAVAWTYGVSQQEYAQLNLRT